MLKKNAAKIIHFVPETKFSIFHFFYTLSTYFAQQGRTTILEGRTISLEGRTLLITFFGEMKFVFVLNKDIIVCD